MSLRTIFNEQLRLSRDILYTGKFTRRQGLFAECGRLVAHNCSFNHLSKTVLFQTSLTMT